MDLTLLLCGPSSKDMTLVIASSPPLETKSADSPFGTAIVPQTDDLLKIEPPLPAYLIPIDITKRNSFEQK